MSLPAPVFTLTLGGWLKATITLWNPLRTDLVSALAEGE